MKHGNFHSILSDSLLKHSSGSHFLSDCVHEASDYYSHSFASAGLNSLYFIQGVDFDCRSCQNTFQFFSFLCIADPLGGCLSSRFYFEKGLICVWNFKIFVCLDLFDSPEITIDFISITGFFVYLINDKKLSLQQIQVIFFMLQILWYLHNRPF